MKQFSKFTAGQLCSDDADVESYTVVALHEQGLHFLSLRPVNTVHNIRIAVTLELRPRHFRPLMADHSNLTTPAGMCYLLAMLVSNFPQTRLDSGQGSKLRSLEESHGQ